MDMGKSRDGCELEKEKISKGLDGSVHVTENEAEGSIEAAKSTSKTMADADAKEKDELVPLIFPLMEMDNFTFQWVTWRREVDRKLFVSIDFDEQNHLIQVTDVSEISLAGEQNRRIRAIPELCGEDLRPGDISEVVSQRTDHEQIQRELQSARNIRW